MLTAMKVLAINCFKMYFLIRQKQCLSLSKKQKFQRKSTKKFTLCRTKVNVKNTNFEFRICKVNTSKMFSINIDKIHKSKSIRSHR